MAQPSPQVLAALQAQIDAHPGIQAALRAAQGKLSPATMRAFGDAVEASGIVLPHDYRIGPNGQISKKDLFGRNPWLGPALAFGGVVGGGLAHGALTGAGAGAGVAGGAGGAGAGAGTAGGIGAGLAGATPGIWKSLLGAGIAGGVPLLLNKVGNNENNGPGSGESPLTPQQQAMMDEMMGLSVDRQRRIAPIHEAAMRMASSMAATGGSSPRINEALARSTRPRPQAQTSPAMLQAIQALMRR